MQLHDIQIAVGGRMPSEEVKMEEHVYIQHMQCQKWPGLAAVQAEWCWQVQAPKCLLLGTSQGNVFPPRGLLLGALPLVTVTGRGAEVRVRWGRWRAQSATTSPAHSQTSGNQQCRSVCRTVLFWIQGDACFCTVGTRLKRIPCGTWVSLLTFTVV